MLITKKIHIIKFTFVKIFLVMKGSRGIKWGWFEGHKSFICRGGGRGGHGGGAIVYKVSLLHDKAPFTTTEKGLIYP